MKKLFLCLLLLSPAVSASAHAFLDHADPKVGASVTGSPSAVSIWYTEPLEPAFSVIEVRNATGTEVDKKDSHIDAKDATHLTVSLPSLPAGTYKVVWHVVSKDTHHTNGGFLFTVK